MKAAVRGFALLIAVAGGLLAPLPPQAPSQADAASQPSYRVLPDERARRARRRVQRPPAQRTAPRAAPRPRTASAPARRPAQPLRSGAPLSTLPPAIAAGAIALAASAPTPALPVTVPLRPARPGARLGPGVAPPPAELEAFVDGLVRDAMSTEHIAGVAVSVVAQTGGAGQVLLNKGYGFADYAPRARPVDPDRTLFRLGSVSKTFTWIALLQQVEAGRMRLDAPVNAYLPEPVQVPERRRFRSVQVRDLLTHTPGFADSALGHLFERDPEDLRPLLTYLAEERPSRVRAPGVLPTYSNYGAALAGAATAQAAGLPFADLVERRITGPLAMTRTSFREPYPARVGLPVPMSSALAASMSEGFHWTGSGFEPRPLELITHVAPAGSASATSGDMARYMLALLNDGAAPNGARIYGPRTAQALRTVLQRSAPGVNGWAHGFMEYSLPGGFTGYGHGGATTAFYTTLVTVPELGLGVFVTTNTDTGRKLVERLPGLVVARFYAPPPAPPPPGSPRLKENAGDYSGTYLSTRRAYSGLEGFASRLGGAAKVSVSDDGRLITSGVGGEQRTWTPDGAPHRFRSNDGDSRLVFEMKDGRAVRWYAPSGGSAYERQSALGGPVTLSLLGNLVLLASLLAIGGAVLRLRRHARASGAQTRSGALELVASALWIVTAAGFAGWAISASDATNILYGWPGPWLLTASTAALLASLLSLVLVFLLIPAWRSDTRHGWTLGRRIRHTITVALFIANAALLASWGALEPWSA